MKKKLSSLGIAAVSLCFSIVLLISAPARAYEIVAHSQGAILSDAPDYDWWYGCSPTSAGMMMGYYDRNGYGGLYYENLVPGGQAELNTFVGTGTYANNAIASSGHIANFYRDSDDVGDNPYLDSNDDQPSGRSFDCLADFMGTSQDSVGNINGSTSFWFNTNGSRLYAKDIYLDGPSYYEDSGMFGMWEYVNYCGYGNSNPATDMNFYNQYVNTYKIQGSTYGQFTFENYKAEIDAGRVVMIHVEGHSMFGYGYDEATDTIYLHDTWYEGQDFMTWGGEYDGLGLRGVTCFTPTGGVVPIPGTLLLLGSGMFGLICLRRKFTAS